MRQEEFRKLTPDAKLAQLRGSKSERRFHIERKAIDESARTVWLSIASEQPYERWWGIEILSLEPGAVRTERLASGAPLLVGHDTADQVGVIEDHEVAGKRLRVKARFGRSARADEIFRDVADGIRPNTSVGYLIHDLERVGVDQASGAEIYRVTDWEPYEGSLVAVPADPTVGVGRSIPTFTTRQHSMEKDERTPAAGTVEAERTRVQDVLACGEEYQKYGGREIARELALDPAGTTERFKERMLARMSTKALATASPAEAMPFGMGARHVLSPGSLRVFRGEQGERNAFAFGQFLRAALPGQGESAAQRWCRDNGMALTRSYMGSSDTTGGYMVPQELAAELIKNMDMYGVFRQEAHRWPMGSDSLTVPTRTSGVTATFVASDTETTATTPNTGAVNLLAKEVMAVTNISRATMDDSPISLGDFVAQEISLAFATLEDQCGFIGDGTSTYGGMTGISNALAAGSKLTAATNHDTAAEIDATDLTNLMAKLPQYAQRGAKWYMSQSMYAGVFLRLLLAAGGNTVRTLEQGALSNPQFAGFPVVLSPTLPTDLSADYTGLQMFYFGDMQRTSAFGDRQQISLLLDPYTLAGKAQIRIIGYERFHVVNHGVGTASVAGPMVSLVGQ